MVKVGLALSSGAVRGFSQVGVLKVLEEAKIPISMISGTSAGALIGTGYALGRSVEDIEVMANSMPWSQMFDLTLSKDALISAKYWNKLIEIYTQGKSFKDAKIPLFIATTNLTKQCSEIHSCGNLQKVVMASMSIPGITPTVSINGDEHVDGGATDPVPFQILSDKGCDVIIAVDLTDKFNWLESSAEVIRLNQRWRDNNELVLHKDVKELLEYINQSRGMFGKNIDKMTHRIIEYLVDPSKEKKERKRSWKMLSVLYESYLITQHELFAERLKNSKNVIFIKPDFSKISKKDFWNTEPFILQGEIATRVKLKEIKDKIRKCQRLSQ